MVYIERKIKRQSGCRWRQQAAVIVLAMGMLAGALAPGFAQELPKILPINPVPGMPNHWIYSGEDPPSNVRVGKLDRLGENEVVVNDFTIRFSTEKEVAFYSKSSASAIPRSRFKVGDLVGCELDKKGRLEILWLFKK